MEVIFLEKNKYKADIDFDNLKHFIKADLLKSYSEDEITNELIYNAFAKNPTYYLTKMQYLSKLSSFEDNIIAIKLIVDKFFVYCIKVLSQCFYVLKAGEVLDKFDDKDMAKMYAHRMDGYIIEVK